MKITRSAALLTLAATVSAFALFPLASQGAEPTSPKVKIQNPKSDLPFLCPLFASNMVLQRDRVVPIWGWTTSGAKVTVTAQGKTVTAKAGDDGKWIAKIGPLKAGGPYTITINGSQSATLSNVLAGDVWVCSGQSNMEMGIGNVTNAESEIASADNPNIRLFTVQKTIAMEPRQSLGQDTRSLMGVWSVCTPDTVRTGGWNGFSAAGYFFGRRLQRDLNIPIGLIHTSWGGTPAEAWTSAEALATMNDFKPALASMVEARSSQSKSADDFARRTADWYAKNDPGSMPGSYWDNPQTDTSAWKTMTLPVLWESAGLPDYDGIVWFRKEIILPDGVEGKAAMIHLGPIDDRDTTWINGVLVGGFDLYNLPRDYKIPVGTLKPGRNVIAVRVLDTGGGGGIYGAAADMHLDVDGQGPVSLAGDWTYKDSLPLKNAKTPLPVIVAGDQNSPTTLYNGMVNPLIPFAIKGAIWYQGESNAGRAYQYRTLLPTMINDWRNRWNEGAFPFYIVSLANFQAQQTQPGDDAWAELREAQSLTAKTLPNSGVAVTIDIGDAGDIHPKDKQDVGDRLARVALAKTYGRKDVAYSGPTYRSMKVEGAAVRLALDHTDGMRAKGNDGQLQGFAIAGIDHKWVWANAKIDGKTIVVSSPQVANPVAVRYAWHTNPLGNLVNASGLPADPFRTDAWPGLTVNNK